jgi:nucleoid-associated protein YgaU
VGAVQQAVLEFDAEVYAPWRPRLGTAGGLRLVGVGESVALPPPPAAVSAVPAAVPAAPVAGTARVAAPPARPTAPREPEGRALPDRGTAGRAVRGGGCAAPARRPRPARARLTRRGRRLTAVLALAGGVALGAWLGPMVTGGAGDDLRLAGVSSVVVEPGDTLWSVAASVAGEEDVRAVIDRIQEINGLDGTGLVPGQVLLLP